MKTKMILFSLVLFLMAGVALAQVEQDDMYFNSKDRAKLRESSKTSGLAMASARKKARQEEDELNNPKDTYSARNVNPEYTSRSHSETAQEDEENYYVSNYRYNNANQYNDWNNNFNNWYGNSWYRTNYWGPSINAWNSPYYGYNNSFNSPWNDPYWSQNGWSSSFSFYYGTGWNYGWGGNYNYWNRPYGIGWDPYYSSNAYWNYYSYPNTIIVINNSESAGRGVAYGKRPTRGSAVVNNNGTRSRSTIVGGSQNPGGGSNGRVRTSQSEYYNPSQNSSSRPAASYGDRSNTQNNRASSWGNSSNYGNSNSRSSYTPSHSSSGSGSSYSGGGRSRGGH